jgi:glucose-1-phosphate thymidylyltransferase
VEGFRFIIPAAGAGTRLSHAGFSKELLPVRFCCVKDEVKPVLAIEHSLFALAEANLTVGSIITSPNKLEMLRYVGDGSRYGLSVVYAVQSVPTGLPAAINGLIDWIGENSVCMVLPDTIFEPLNSVEIVCRHLRDTESDVVLGVFPTDEPERLGPVKVATDGAVLMIQDKPAVSCANNTWGIAAWGPRFTTLVRVIHRESLTLSSKELPLGYIFDRALNLGMKVHAVSFADGYFLDIGTPQGLMKSLLKQGLGLAPFPLTNGK